MSVLKTVDVFRWVERAKAQATEQLLHHDTFWNQELMIKLFDGPTPGGRSDFHINTCPEFFFQLVGEMSCRVLEDGKFKDLVVNEGEMFFLPPLLPHLNSRPKGSIGLVIHTARAKEAKDAVAWYCEQCGQRLHRIDYDFKDLQEQLPPLIELFLSSQQLRTCSSCGWVMPQDQGRMS